MLHPPLHEGRDMLHFGAKCGISWVNTLFPSVSFSSLEGADCKREIVSLSTEVESSRFIMVLSGVGKSKEETDPKWLPRTISRLLGNS